ncbi:MAG: hypothetical protein KAF91_29945 [Nostoc sp. TH1S01]|nr:hypothetical protein [Nostoc sp. TH1S01]
MSDYSLVVWQLNFAWWQAGGQGKLGRLGEKKPCCQIVLSPPAQESCTSPPARLTRQFWFAKPLDAFFAPYQKTVKPDLKSRKQEIQF